MTDNAVDPGLLADKNVFFGLSDAQLAAVAALSRRMTFAPGTSLFSEGDPGDALYIVESGLVELSRAQAGGGKVVLATVKAGALLGEMSLVNIEPRSATGVAVESTTAIRVGNRELSEVMKEDRDLLVLLLLNITRILSKRLRQADQRIV